MSRSSLAKEADASVRAAAAQALGEIGPAVKEGVPTLSAGLPSTICLRLPGCTLVPAVLAKFSMQGARAP
jgi:hypothetical protein